MAKVFVTHEIPQPGIDALKDAGHDVTVHTGSASIPRSVLLEKVQDVDALIPLLTDTIDAEVLNAAGDQLKIVANYAVGFDNIDVDAAKERGIIVTNTPGVLTQTVAEHAIAMMLTLGRRLTEADQFVRAGKYKGWDPDLLIGTEFHRKTIGIIGAGRIGYTVAKIASAGLGMKVAYTNRRKNEMFETEFHAQQRALNELCAEADVISIHVPLTEETHHLIGSEQLQQMQLTTLLINTARGPVIDEQALVDALKAGQVGGAALDVFEHEPALTEGLNELDNVLLAPHIGSATVEARTEMALLAARNVNLVLSGDDPATPVV